MRELIFNGVIRAGEKGRRAKLVQEWLYLHGVRVVIDGKFGPATAAAVRQFQRKHGIKTTGSVGETTFARLVSPMRNALQRIERADLSLGSMVVAYARQHLTQSPREVGGQNRGPWVRLYMHGNEGAEWPWCAGFVSFVLRQAADTVGQSLPIRTSFSCDLLAASATGAGCMAGAGRRIPPAEVKPGSVFLVRRAVGDWEHAGIVVRADPEVFVAIEGNTNDSGDREGYEVCERVRGYRNKDFILLGA